MMDVRKELKKAGFGDIAIIRLTPIIATYVGEQTEKIRAERDAAIVEIDELRKQLRAINPFGQTDLGSTLTRCKKRSGGK